VQVFNDLASVLKYLKLCLATVLLDEARGCQRRPYLSLDDVVDDAFVCADHSAQIVGRVARDELWQAISRELIDDNERLYGALLLRGWAPTARDHAAAPRTTPNRIGYLPCQTKYDRAA
jgi:hypothetical protein